MAPQNRSEEDEIEALAAQYASVGADEADGGSSKPEAETFSTQPEPMASDATGAQEEPVFDEEGFQILKDPGLPQQEEQTYVDPDEVPPPESIAQQAPPKPSALQRFAKYVSGAPRAAVAGILNYNVQGFPDEMAGVLGAQRNMLDAARLGPSVPVPNFTDAYQSRRDEYRRTEEALKDEYPGEYHLAGLASSLLVPGPRFGGGRGGAAASGGLMGAVSGFGNSTADITKGDYPGALRDTVAGGGLGATFGAGAHEFATRLPGWADRFSRWLGEAAERRAVKAVTGQNQRAIMSMLDKDTLQETGRDLLDEGVVRAGRSVEDIRNAADELQQAAGAEKAWNLEALDNAMPAGRELHPDEMVGNAFADVVGPMRQLTAGDNKVADRLSDELRALLQQGRRVFDIPDASNPNGFREAVTFDNPTTLQAADRFKTALDQFIHWTSPEPLPNQQGLRSLRGNLNSQIENKVDQVVEAVPDMLPFADQFREAKRLFGSMANVAQPGLKQQARETANRLVSASDYGVGGVGGLGAGLTAALASGGDFGTTAMIGGAGALLGAMGNKFARERGNQVAADWGNRLSQSEFLMDLAMQDPQRLGRWAKTLTDAAAKGPGAFGIQDWLLAQTDPDYAEQRKQVLQGVGGSVQVQ